MRTLNVDDIVAKVRYWIFKEGHDELRYELNDGDTLVIHVIAYAHSDGLDLAVERINSVGYTVECATSDYVLDDKELTAMIENALLADSDSYPC